MDHAAAGRNDGELNRLDQAAAIDRILLILACAGRRETLSGAWIPDYGGIATLSPGLWKVTGISCGRLTYDGEFGEIQIRSGEIINGGYLVLDGRGRSGRTHTEDLTPLTLASIRKRAPLTFGKAMKRYFTIRRP